MENVANDKSADFDEVSIVYDRWVWVLHSQILDLETHHPSISSYFFLFAFFFSHAFFWIGFHGTFEFNLQGRHFFACFILGSRKASILHFIFGHGLFTCNFLSGLGLLHAVLDII